MADTLLDTRGRSALQRALDAGTVTQVQVGEATGAAQSTVSGWRGGTGRPDAFQREALDKLLGIAPGAWISAEERERLRRVRRLHARKMRAHGLPRRALAEGRGS